jgi:DNA-binding winged helix-turn-helix (wHTH) protein/tetratricopeptide (TPR) repeat protein
MPPRLQGSIVAIDTEHHPASRSNQGAGSRAARTCRQAGDTESSTKPAGRGVRESACSFASFRLEADGTLWRGEAVVHLPPKELAALRMLVEYSGRVVSPAQLKQELWGDVHVTAESVPKCVSSLRARLEPDTCIQTVYKRGYRFSAEIRRDGASTAGKVLRLAILPFRTGYSVPEHLGPAIAEETTSSLSRAPQFNIAVLARDSVFNLAQRGLTAQQIGQELKADLVLTGSIQAFSSRYRLRAEMIRIEDGTQIWVEDMLALRSRARALESHLIERLAYRLGIDTEDGASWPLEWQGEISTETAFSAAPSNQAGVEISAAAESVDEHAARQKDAYDLFLRGHYEWQTLHRHRMQDGLRRLLKAIELDPTLIFAKIDLAHLCVAQALYGFMPTDAAAGLVHRMAESIPDLPQRAPALLPPLGWVNFHYDRNLPSALLAFSFSAHLPHDPWTTRARVLFALSRHRFSEAAELLRAAIRIDPFSPWLQSRLAWALHLDGQAGESLEQIHKCISLFPNGDGTSLYGAVILAFNGETGQACEMARTLEQRLPHFDLATAAHAYALACAGQTDEARIILERLQWLGRERCIVRGFTPAAYAAQGDHEAALAELRAANEARCPWFFQAIADPRLNALRGNPEFERMRAILPAMEAEVEQELGMEG